MAAQSAKKASLITSRNAIVVAVASAPASVTASNAIVVAILGFFGRL
jgi:hypothetical protein